MGSGFPAAIFHHAISQGLCRALRTETERVKPLIRALRGEGVIPPPLWLMRQAGRYLPEYRRLREKSKSFLDFCYSPELAVEASLQPIRRFAFDAAILFSDILVVPDALGQKVSFVEGEGPALQPVDGLEEFARLRPAQIHERLEPVYETVRQLKRQLPAATALIGFAGAPWTIAVYMVEGRGGTNCEKIKKLALQESAAFSSLIGILGQAISEYLIRQVKNGADVIQIFDSWAGILCESEFRRWVIAPTAAIVKNVRAACPGVPVIGFPRGAGALYADYVRETRIDAIGIDSAVPLAWAARELQSRVPVQGNLDNVALLAGGAALEEEARRILAALAAGPFVFNLGHGVLPETPPENVARLAEIVRAWKAPGP
jgi:uroporphyrinogen decarboxylase